MDCSLSTLRSSQCTFCEPAGCSEPNAAWSFDSSAVAPQGNKPVSGHLASLGDNEPKQLGVCCSSVCFGLAHMLVCLYLHSKAVHVQTIWHAVVFLEFYFPFLWVETQFFLEDYRYFLLVSLNLMGWRRSLHCATSKTDIELSRTLTVYLLWN